MIVPRSHRLPRRLSEISDHRLQKSPLPRAGAGTGFYFTAVGKSLGRTARREGWFILGSAGRMVGAPPDFSGENRFPGATNSKDGVRG
jgi:hypothetical protein